MASNRVRINGTGNGTGRMSHEERVEFIDNTQEVLAQLNANKSAALQAIGIKAVGLIVEQMETGYHIPHKNRPHGKKYINVFGQRLKNDDFVDSDGGTHTAIRDTGDLMRDVAYAVENSKVDTVDVGNSLEYAPHVHEGTSRMVGRPYIVDAITKGADALEKVTAAYLKKGM